LRVSASHFFSEQETLMLADLFSPNVIATGAAILALAVIWLRVYRETVAYRLALWWELFPGLGRIAKRHQNASLRVPVVEGSRITRAEHAFVAGFLPYIGRGLTRRAFENKVAYVTKAEDAGIHPLAPPVLVSLAVLLAIPEGWSAGYVLLPWVSDDISAAMRDTWAAVLGYFLAAVFYVLAHWAGGLFRKSRHAARHFEAWQEDNQRGNLTPREIAPGQDQSQDDTAPVYEQFFARCRSRVWPSAPYLVAVVLLIFGLGITALRYAGVHRGEVRAAFFAQQMAAQSQQEESVSQNPPLSGTLGGSSSPTEAERDLGFVLGQGVALGIFLLSFMAVQAIGFMAGATETPNGDRTKEAFKVLKGLTSFELYEENRERRIAQLEPVYAALQAGLVVRGRTSLPTLREVIAWLERDRQNTNPPEGSPEDDLAVVPFQRTRAAAVAGGAK
jgi:hypothetical protein